jgi:neutral ceramidase
MSFSISTAKADITPKPGANANPYMGGYGVQGGLRVVTSNTPQLHPLYAKCVILWEDSYPHAIVSLDILGIPRSVHLAVRPRLVALANWASSDIVLVASHTHNGPVVGDMLDPFIAYDLSNRDVIVTYTKWLEDRVVTLVKDALAASRTTVTLDYRVAFAGFAFNRAGLPTVETAVPIITARSGNGSRRAILYSYGCHPVSAGWQEEWDGDWPAEASDIIEDETGAFALFLPGPAGDQDPAGVRGWDLRNEHGSTVGGAVVSASATPGRSLTSPMRSQFRDVALPLDITATPANLSAVRAAFAARMPNPGGQPAWYQRHAESMITRIDSGTFATSVPNPSQVWRLGGSPQLKLAFVGGELVSGYAAYFRARHGGTNGLFIGGYANETSCYVPADNFLPPLAPSWGSYEGGWDSDHPGIAGGSMIVYPQIAHFRAGASGVESAVIGALTQQLA